MSRSSIRRWIVRLGCCSLFVAACYGWFGTQYIAPVAITPDNVVESMGTSSSLSPTSPEVRCLAQTLYFEAAHESLPGLQAVASVVFNRAKSSRYPHNLCAVVYQPGQFSWTSNPRKRRQTPSARYVQLAVQMLRDRAILQEAYPVTHFHHVKVSPSWSRRLTHLMTIGPHKFYG